MAYTFAQPRYLFFENFSKNNHMTLKDVVAHLSVLLEEHGDYTFAVISKGQGLKLTGKKVGLEIDDENKVITLIDTGK